MKRYLLWLLPLMSLSVTEASYPLHEAVKLGGPSRVRACLNSACDPNERNGAGYTPLMVAAAYDRSTSTRILLEANAFANAVTFNYGTTAMMIAAMNGYHEVVQELINGGASLNQQNKSGYTALMLAAQKGHAHVVRILLSRGASPSVRDYSQRTALDHAATAEIRQLLSMAPGAAVNHASSVGERAQTAMWSGNTTRYPLHDAVKVGRPSKVKQYLQTHDVNERNDGGHTPLMVAAMYDRSTSAKLLIEAGAHTYKTSANYGTTALMIAAMNGYHEVVQELINGGASLNQQNKSGYTALMLAAQKGQTEVVRQLLVRGADPQIKDYSNRTALDHAAMPEVRQLLMSEVKIMSAGSSQTLAVSIPPNGKVVQFPVALWDCVKNVNARLEKVLKPVEYGYLLTCQLFWWKKLQEKRRNAHNSNYDSPLVCLMCGMRNVAALVHQLEEIADNPEKIKGNRLPFWIKQEKQGVREREYITDLTDDIVAANEKLIVGLDNNVVQRYSFWDAHTGTLMNRLQQESTYPLSPEVSKDGYYWLQPLTTEDSSPDLPFLGDYQTIYDESLSVIFNSLAVVNPYTNEVISPILFDLGEVSVEDLKPDAYERSSSDKINESDARGWLKAGAQYFDLSYPRWWSSASTAGSMVKFEVDPLFFVRGTKDGFVLLNQDRESFSINLKELRYSRTSHDKKLPWIKCSYRDETETWLTPFSVTLGDYARLKNVGHPLLAGVSEADFTWLSNLPPVQYRVKTWKSDGESEKLESASIPLSADGVRVCVMSNWQELFSGVQPTWGPWELVIHHEGKNYRVDIQNKLVDVSEKQLHESHKSDNPMLVGIPLHLKKQGNSAQVLINSRDTMRVYHIDFSARKLSLLKEWACPSPANLRAFYIPDMQMLAQPVSAHRYELLRLDDVSWNTEKVADLYLNRHGDYAVVLPDGSYAGSPGCEKMLEYAEGDHVIGMKTLAPWRNRPAKVLEYLNGHADAIAALKATTDRWLRRQGYNPDDMLAEPAVDNFPVAEVKYPALQQAGSETTDFEVTLRAQRKAITTLHVQVDGTSISLPENENMLIPAGQSKTLHVRVPVAIGQNWVEITPVDSMGVVGDTQRFRIINNDRHESNLYVVALGVSQYADASMNLQYAAKDARDLAGTFEQYGMGKVQSLVLTDAEVTRESSLQKVREFLASTTVHDRVVMYIAGHGMLDEKLDYYYAPHHFNSDSIAETGISLDSLVSCLQSAPARNRLLLMDTCQSGLLGEAGEEKLAMAGMTLPPGVRAIRNRGMKVKKATAGFNAGQQKRYIEDMFAMGNTHRGVNIIAAAAGEEFALESDQWQNGVFCAAVCESLKSVVDFNADGLTSIDELVSSVSAKVKELTGGRQNISMVALENPAMPLGGTLKNEKWDESMNIGVVTPHPYDPLSRSVYYNGAHTPLHEAIYNSDSIAVQKALQSGQYLNQRDAFGKTPLMVAAERKHLPFMELLLKAGADVNLMSLDGESALSLAIGHDSSPKIVELLIQNGVDVNLQNKRGETALMKASFVCNNQIVRLLLQHGASKTIKDNYGYTAADFASDSNLKELLR